MTITVPEELERDLAQRAEQLGVEPVEVVRRAVARFLYVEPELQAELDVWQRASWKAWATVEESLR
jgi:predicted transcriptional regulator